MRVEEYAERRDEAIKLFADGRNCAQSVLMVFTRETGFSSEKLAKLLCGAGGGMGGMGHTCGAVTGAVIALSAILGGESISEHEKNLSARNAVACFIQTFGEQYGHLTCSGLIGVDVRNDMAREEARAVGVHRLTCAKVVSGAVELVCTIVNERNGLA